MKSIQWPALLKLEGADDLIYVEGAQDWHGLYEQCPDTDDRLCDSRGQLYKLQCLGQQLVPVTLTDKIDLKQLNDWVRNHLVAMQQCCVYKIELESIDQAMQMVRDTQES